MKYSIKIDFSSYFSNKGKGTTKPVTTCIKMHIVHLRKNRNVGKRLIKKRKKIVSTIVSTIQVESLSFHSRPLYKRSETNWKKKKETRKRYGKAVCVRVCLCAYPDDTWNRISEAERGFGWDRENKKRKGGKYERPSDGTGGRDTRGSEERERERERRALDLSRQLNEFPLGWNGKRLEKRLPLRKIFRRALLDIREVISGRRRGAVCGLEVIHENTLDVRLSLSLFPGTEGSSPSVHPSALVCRRLSLSLSLSFESIPPNYNAPAINGQTRARTHTRASVDRPP